MYFIIIILYVAHGPHFSYADYGSEVFPTLKSYRFNWFKRQTDGSIKRPTWNLSANIEIYYINELSIIMVQVSP